MNLFAAFMASQRPRPFSMAATRPPRSDAERGIGILTNGLAPVIFQSRPAKPAAKPAKPSASTSARSAKPKPIATSFAHLAPTNDRLGLHAAADAARAAHAAEATERAAEDADRELALRIIAAGQARRGEPTASTRRAAAAPIAQSVRAEHDLAMKIVAAGKARRGEK